MRTVSRVPPRSAFCRSNVPPSARTRCLMAANPCMPWAASIAGTSSPSSVTRNTTASSSMSRLMSTLLTPERSMILANASCATRNSAMAASAVNFGSSSGKYSVHLSPARAQVSLNCQRSAAMKPTLSSNVGRSSSMMRRFKSMPAERFCCTRFRRWRSSTFFGSRRCSAHEISMRAPTSSPPSSSCSSRASVAFSRSATLCRCVESSTSSRVRASTSRSSWARCSRRLIASCSRRRTSR